MLNNIIRNDGVSMRQKLGMSLVEVMVATGIFAIGFGGLLVGQQFARNKVEVDLINMSVYNYANSLVEILQSYDFEDQIDYPQTNDLESDSATAFGAHDATIGAYDLTSGIYDSSDNLVQALPEERLTLKYHPTTVGAGATALDPFDRNALQDNIWLIGPEDSDVHADSAPDTGYYRIDQDQADLNIFGTGQEKYFFMDDVDDFDGYLEVREVWPGVPVTFEVSVTGIFDNFNNFTYDGEYNDSSAFQVTLPQNRYEIMQPISVENLKLLAPTLADANVNVSEIYQCGYAYYNNMMFKKITVKATYEFPIGSGTVRTIVIDGGVVKEGASAF